MLLFVIDYTTNRAGNLCKMEDFSQLMSFFVSILAIHIDSLIVFSCCVTINL